MKYKVGDKVIYIFKPWMGGIKQPICKISAYISKIRANGCYDLVREIDGQPSKVPLRFNVLESEILSAKMSNKG